VLEPAPANLFRGGSDPEDPRLANVVRRWPGGPCDLRSRQVVLIGFPCDEGVRRNHGRPGAALAPNAIRERLYRFTPWDPLAQVDVAALDLYDLGDVQVGGDLEAAQQRLGDVTARVLRAGAVPVILGGGHETAFGHYLGYAGAGLECGIINVDAHLDVRPFAQGPHSGSPFRQALEHPTHPLGSGCYVVIGAQRQSVARAHWEFVQRHQGRVHWVDAAYRSEQFLEVFTGELDRLGTDTAGVLVTVDADAFRQADVPAASAPSPAGLDGMLWPELAFRAGSHPAVRSIDVVEVNPLYDRDDQAVCWAALGARQFLIGLATRLGTRAS
jgi:formiminoglutamase